MGDGSRLPSRMDGKWPGVTWAGLVTVVVVLASMAGDANGQGRMSFGASNYFGVGGNFMSNGLWWVQTNCPWGVSGFRSPSQYQCGTFQCPSTWYGSTTYQCPPPTLYSNSLQRCVVPTTLANSCQSSNFRYL